jgi:tetratricopeptide (TPR) repeat protein
MRQKHYFEGKACEAAEDFLGAIQAYETYSTWLKPEDRHIPFQWIADLYLRLGNEEEALQYLSKHAAGCSAPRAADLFRQIGSEYERLNNLELALEAYEAAAERNPKNPPKKKIDDIKSILRRK